MHRRGEWMADLLDQTLAEIRARLKELGPVVAEYERLAAAAQALNGGSPAAQTSRTAARRRSTVSASPRAARGANKQKVYAAIDARPGATAAELAEASGVAKPIIYNVTRQGVKTGE